MKVLRELSALRPGLCTVVTIGAFDGVHLGHQQLIRQTVDRSQSLGCESTVISFEPLPRQVLDRSTETPYLTTLSEKVQLIERLQPSALLVLPFTPDLAQMSPEQFLQAVREHLEMRELWVGERFALGRNRSGDIKRLAEIGEELGFDVRVCRSVMVDEQMVSSSGIRALVLDGHVEKAARMLGRCHSMTGQVVAGNQRGRELGFPTANVETDPLRATPVGGVYAVLVDMDHGDEEASLLGVMNIGTCPSFGGGSRSLEVHLLDYRGDLYQRRLRISFVAKLRDEIRFESIEELRAQIARDIETARQVLRDPSCAHLPFPAGTLSVPGV